MANWQRWVESGLLYYLYIIFFIFIFKLTESVAIDSLGCESRLCPKYRVEPGKEPKMCVCVRVLAFMVMILVMDYE